MELIRKQVEKLIPVGMREEIVEASVEAIVPDSFSDVIRIVGAFGDVNIRDKSVQPDRLVVGGICEIRVLCITERSPLGEIIDVSLPISHISSFQGCKVESISTVDSDIYECSAEMLNSRKLLVKIKAVLNMSIYNKSSLWLTDNTEQDDDIYALRQDFCDEYTLAIASKQIRIVENIALDNGELKPLRWDLNFISEDVKLLKNKIMLRGNCQLRVLFFDAHSGELTREKYHLPYSCVIENENFDENLSISVSYIGAHGETFINSSGGSVVLNCDICTEISAEVKKSISQKILADAFSSTYETQIDYEKITGRLKKEEEIIKKELSATFESITNADKLCDFTYSCQCRKTDTELLFASIAINIIYKDTEEEMYNVCLRHDFDVECKAGVYSADISLENLSLQCTAVGSVSFECTAVLDVIYGETIELSQISKCEILKDAVKTKTNNATLVLRNVAANETIWDIAKKYNTSPDAILQANKLCDGSALTRGRLIMIPIVK